MRHQYTLGYRKVENSTEERDLGVRIHENLVGAQVAEAVKNTNRMLGMISRTYYDKSISTMLQLYNLLDYIINYQWKLKIMKTLTNLRKD